MSSLCRLSLLLGLSFVGTALTMSCSVSLCGKGYYDAPLLAECERQIEGEEYIFKGRIVDAETGERLKNASVRLELLRILGPTADSLFQRFGYDTPVVSFSIVSRCGVVDSLGSTGAYPKLNAFYRRHDLERFIFQRDTARTDSLGLFQLRSTEESHMSPHTEGDFQRVVVKKEGYRLFSQGVLSKCKGHLQALRPVELVPKLESTSEGTELRGRSTRTGNPR